MSNNNDERVFKKLLTKAHNHNDWWGCLYLQKFSGLIVIVKVVQRHPYPSHHSSMVVRGFVHQTLIVYNGKTETETERYTQHLCVRACV
jgi:hypothetical protein